jgi:serine O-acetyltransferase
MQECPQERFLEIKRCDFLDSLVEKVCATYKDEKGINHIQGFNLPQEKDVLEILHNLVEIIFPGFSGRRKYSLDTIHYNIGEIISRVYMELVDQIFQAFRYNCEMNNCKDCDTKGMSERAARALLEQIPSIREVMKDDITAAFDGDPAARSLDEIVVSYPGIKAITIQRLAHVLYNEGVPLLPRMMTEHAHSVTGIDIHPGATLGRGLFIDHGTGVVIGETAIIGNNVKIFMGVTLGALSFPKDACGKIIKGRKRHPTVEDNVTIYSNATILGDITLGEGSIIGGNVWLTEDIEAGSKITIRPPELTIKTGKK